jgi:hypothetical protein
MKNSTQVTKSIRPNLDHRFCQLFDDHRDLTDTINIMAIRAKSVLYLLSSQFESEDDNTLCNEIIYDSISSVICELNDIQAYLKAFSESQTQFDISDYLTSLNAKNPR